VEGAPYADLQTAIRILHSTVKGNCLIFVAEERSDYESGEEVWVEPFPM
jgi:molybdopterin biosynthesis enzyme